jgi:hypothetical protein
MRALAWMALAAATSASSATCNSVQPAPAPAVVVVDRPAPEPVDAGPPCASGCAAAQAACPKPNHTAAECEANCRDVVRFHVQTAACAARVFTCELGCP